MKELNPNVKFFMFYTSTQAIGRGIWLGNILSLYVILLTEKTGGFLGLNPNETLGITSAVSGLAIILIVIPAGFLTDRWSREGVLKISLFAGITGLALLAVGKGIPAILGGLLFWGLFQGLSRPASDALIADSVSTGRRSGIYAKFHMIEQISMGAGPLLNIFLFFIMGDRWELDILKNVMFVGLLFSALSAVSLLMLKEKHTLGLESESIPVNTGLKIDQPFTLKKPANNPQIFVPYVLLISNFIIGFGAGMTIKFFPVFFKSIYHLQPVFLQIIMGLTFLITGLSSLTAQKLSMSRGRAEIILTVQTAAIICLIGMSFYPSLCLLIPLFILRSALMNAAIPLSRSILMDFIPKQRRGIWNSLQTVAWGLFWNVSSVLGGFLIGDNNFRLCFLITAGIYTIGTLPMLLIIPLVKKEYTVES